MHYKVHSTNKGQIPSVRCKSCKDNPPLKSNTSIIAELQRLIAVGGIHTLEETIGCRNPDCENNARVVAQHRRCYQKMGKAPGGGQYYRCKACGRQMLLSSPVRLRQKNRSLAVDVFGRIVYKAPMRRAVNGAKLNSNGDYYRILRFIEARCRAYSRAFDRAMIDGRLQLPGDICIEADAQVYTLNWISRLDRRNVEIHAYCSVDTDSRFIFGTRSFDPTVDPLEINAKAPKQGDLQAPEAFREYARYWLAGDEPNAGRALSRSVVKRRDLLDRISALYAQAASRRDVENIELQLFDASFRTCGVRIPILGTVKLTDFLEVPLIDMPPDSLICRVDSN